MRLAVLGLGAMGARIATRLMAADYEVQVWNRTLQRAEDVAAGRREVIAESPAAAVAGAEAVITMVSDSVALSELLAPEVGVIAGLAPGAALIQMSTVGPTAIATLASSLSSEVELVDAPVLGSLVEAERGTLRVLVGATSAGLDTARPVLETLGTVHYVGPPGSGSSAKLVVNAALLGVVGLLGESLALALGFGMSEEVAFDLLALTPLADQAMRRRPLVEADRYPSRFSLDLAAKDSRLILEAAKTADLDVRLMEASARWFTDGQRAGLGGLDYTAVLCVILSQGSRRAG